MKRFQITTFFILLFTLALVACQPSSVSQPSDTADIPGEAEPIAEPLENLPLIPPLEQPVYSVIGDPLPGGVYDPFSDASIAFDVRLAVGSEMANVHRITYIPMDQTQARALADQLGFPGPLFIQRIPEEYAPPPGQESPPVYTVFDGQRIMTISETGIAYENRGIVVDYSQRPVLENVATKLESQFKAWGILDFPYELHQTPIGDIVINRLVDGIAVDQNAFNFLVTQSGEIAYFDYRPGRQVEIVGNYPLQTAEAAFQNIQTAEDRETARYQLYFLPDSSDIADESFVMPRSWSPVVESGQEVHIYMTPIVYEATSGGELHLIFGEYTLAGSDGMLAEIAGHLGDTLHVWGTVDMGDGAKRLNVSGWEKLEIVQYESFEGTVVEEDGQTLFKTADGDAYIIQNAPEIPQDIEVYVSAAARRDIDEAYPLLDWTNITEKVAFPEEPMGVGEEWPAVQSVTIHSAELVYAAVYEQFDSPADESSLLIPSWKFVGSTDLGQEAVFWAAAVAPQYQQELPKSPSEQPLSGHDSNSASISGWVWHDECKPAEDGAPAPAAPPDGCVDDSALGHYRANGVMDVHEAPIADVIVRLGEGECPSTGLAETVTVATDLSYSFTGLPAGTYCVSINAVEEQSVLLPGLWTYPEVADGTIETAVTLQDGQNVFDVNFGWDYQFLP